MTAPAEPSTFDASNRGVRCAGGNATGDPSRATVGADDPVLGGSRKLMAARKKAAKAKKPADLIISKSRTKAAAKKCNVGSEFYEALDKAVRQMIQSAEGRAIGNKRKTLKAVDL